MRRATLLLAIALQMLGGIAPAKALIICISNDGCVQLEPSMAGAGRCAEADCDRGHATSDHGCRDIPVVADAVGPKSAPPTGGDTAHPPALLPALARIGCGVAAPPAPADTRARDRAVPRRTIVLQL